MSSLGRAATHARSALHSAPQPTVLLCRSTKAPRPGSLQNDLPGRSRGAGNHAPCDFRATGHACHEGYPPWIPGILPGLLVRGPALAVGSWSLALAGYAARGRRAKLRLMADGVRLERHNAAGGSFLRVHDGQTQALPPTSADMALSLNVGDTDNLVDVRSMLCRPNKSWR